MSGVCLAIKNFPDFVMGVSHRRVSVASFLMCAATFHTKKKEDGAYPPYSRTGEDQIFEPRFSQDEDAGLFSQEIDNLGGFVAVLVSDMRSNLPGGDPEWRLILNDLPVRIRSVINNSTSRTQAMRPHQVGGDNIVNESTFNTQEQNRTLL